MSCNSKKCGRCGETKSLDHFTKQQASPDGHGYYCANCRREYRQENKDHVRELETKRRAANPEAARQRLRDWRANNPEKYEAQKKRRYANKRGEILSQTKKAKEKRREWLANYKSAHGCAVCGCTIPYMLDLHHIDPSTKEFCVTVSCGRPIAVMEQEASKCEVLCSNHHRELHHREGYRVEDNNVA